VNRTVLVTGGAGFIGSNFVRHTLKTHPSYRVKNLDKLTYSGNLDNLGDVADDPRYEFVRGDIADSAVVRPLVDKADVVVNFAAESHVDRSIDDPRVFLRSNIEGPYELLEAARASGVERFLQVSTDEVYGEVMSGSSVEGDPLAPRSPYAASKAAGELLVQSYHVTYGVPTIVTRGSNTIGPHQYPEKVVPLFITNALDDEPLPIYGPGTAVRDYLHVDDHCRGIDHALHHGTPGQAYNVGAGNEVNTLELSTAILGALGKPHSLVNHVKDRPGHDQRYSVDTKRLRDAGWRLHHPFEESLGMTIDWYQRNRAWWQPIKQGDYARWYERHYGSGAVSDG
jgi:dTDP-glucose 4,6-dehydratase